MKNKSINSREIITLGLIILMLSGCATLSRPLSLTYKQSINNIAVVSVMGDNFEGKKIGTTVFNNEQFEDDFSFFNVDEKIEETVAQYLKNHSGFNSIIRSDLREEFRGSFDYDSKPKQSLSKLSSRLHDLRAEEMDAVLVVSQGSCSFENFPEYLNGYGVAVRSFLMLW